MSSTPTTSSSTGTKGDGVVGLGYLDPYLKDAFVTKVDGARPVDGRDHLVAAHEQADPLLHPDPAPAHLEERHRRPTSPTSRTRPPVVGTGPYQAVESTSQYVRLIRNPELLGQAGRRGRDRHPVLPERAGHDGRGVQEQRARLHPQPERRASSTSSRRCPTRSPWPARATASPSSTTTRTPRAAGRRRPPSRTPPSARPWAMRSTSRP